MFIKFMIIPRFLYRFFDHVDKRQRFVISTLILTFLILMSSFLTFNQIKYFVFIIAGMVYFLTFFSILEGIKKFEWLMLFILPVYFTTAFVLFYFLLPVRWLTRLPFIIIYGISIYAILLSSNIFNVGVEKSLQLFRAAFSVNYLFLTLTLFLMFNLILSFQLNFFINFVLIFLFTLPINLQFLWSINPKIIIESAIIKYALLIALIIAEIGLVFSFVPIKSTLLAIFLTACFYGLVGLFQAYIEERLFRERIREYIFVFIFVFIITILSISW